jgi:antitoxin component YwqK of YwqJK toxin-antitoxin module
MRIHPRQWRWNLAALAALFFPLAAAPAQQPLGGVQVAEPVPALEKTEKEPTPAVPPSEAKAPAPLPTENPATEQTAAPIPSPDAVAPGEEPATTDDALVELVKERYPSGAIKIEREVTQDVEGNYLLHGSWRQFDEQGRLMVDGRLVRNQKEGLWRRFYRGDETPLLATAPYREFTAPFVSSATFHKGGLHGKWTVTDSKQRLVHEVEFTGNERHGKATWYYSTGAIMLQAIYDHGFVNGDVVKFAADGMVVARENFQSGRKLAPKIDYHDQARQVKKQEVTYLHATLVVKTPDSWERGTLAVFDTRGKDEKHGPFTAWHRNGQLARQGEFRYDQPVGQLAYWYPSGQKQLEGTYVDGRQQGVWTWWHENGQKSITGEYHDAKPVGQWSWWTASGKIAQKADLSQDRAVIEQTPEAQSELREAKLRPVEPGLKR